MDTGMAIVAAMGLVVLIALIFVVPVWLLWNGLIPELFGGPTITFWQALGLLFLSSMLFKSSSRSSK